jgi:hypothetical protein
MRRPVVARAPRRSSQNVAGHDSVRTLFSERDQTLGRSPPPQNAAVLLRSLHRHCHEIVLKPIEADASGELRVTRTKPQRRERRDLRLLLRELGMLTAQYLCAAEASLISVYSDISRAKWLLMSCSPIAPAMLLIPWRRRNAT